MNARIFCWIGSTGLKWVELGWGKMGKTKIYEWILEKSSYADFLELHLLGIPSLPWSIECWLNSSQSTVFLAISITHFTPAYTFTPADPTVCFTKYLATKCLFYYNLAREIPVCILCSARGRSLPRHFDCSQPHLRRNLPRAKNFPAPKSKNANWGRFIQEDFQIM